MLQAWWANAGTRRSSIATEVEVACPCTSAPSHSTAAACHGCKRSELRFYEQLRVTEGVWGATFTFSMADPAHCALVYYKVCAFGQLALRVRSGSVDLAHRHMLQLDGLTSSLTASPSPTWQLWIIHLWFEPHSRSITAERFNTCCQDLETEDGYAHELAYCRLLSVYRTPSGEVWLEHLYLFDEADLNALPRGRIYLQVRSAKSCTSSNCGLLHRVSHLPAGEVSGSGTGATLTFRLVHLAPNEKCLVCVPSCPRGERLPACAIGQLHPACASSSAWAWTMY